MASERRKAGYGPRLELGTQSRAVSPLSWQRCADGLHQTLPESLLTGEPGPPAEWESGDGAWNLGMDSMGFTSTERSR